MPYVAALGARERRPGPVPAAATGADPGITRLREVYSNGPPARAASGIPTRHGPKSPMALKLDWRHNEYWLDNPLHDNAGSRRGVAGAPKSIGGSKARLDAMKDYPIITESEP